MKIKVLLFLVCLLAGTFAFAQSDLVDILHYDIEVDMGHQSDRSLVGKASLQVNLLGNQDTLWLDLQGATVDSVVVDGQPRSYTYDGRSLGIITLGASSMVPTIYYATNGRVESYGWGGLHMDANLYYSLGVAFQEYPHNYGRAWMPCRDNFYDKATYDITITTKPNWNALVSGVLLSSVENEDGSKTTHWHLNQPTPTYLVGLAVGPYRIINREYEGVYGSYPAMIGYISSDSSAVYRTFDILEDVVPMYERCFGPYRWERIGYVATPKGSMEHATNIALVNNCIAALDAGCQGVVAHEFGHAWFGNLVTCASSEDMWINEGGATFCEEVAFESAFGKEYSNNYYHDYLYGVLTSAHVKDGGYFALHGVTPDITYGSTTYEKGGIVWHSLRGYLGDSLFYASMRRLFDRCAFGNVDAYQLRDSLSLYSGVDLTEFFKFHVFNPGFVDYHIDSLRVNGRCATVAIHQRVKEAPALMNKNRVPVTFYSQSLERCKRLVEFDGEQVVQSFDLPFEAIMAYIDADQELSDAVTDAEFTLTAEGVTKESDKIYFSLKTNQLYDTTFLKIAHHFANPDASSAPGVIRMAKRYWTVAGRMAWENQISGRFRYERGTSRSAVDYGFYNNVETLDSMVVLYRRDASEDWHIVSCRHTSNTNNGNFIVDYLRPGDYALAVVDTSLLSIQDNTGMNNRQFISPNPSCEDFRVDAESGILRMFDVVGKKVLETIIDTPNKVVHHQLQPGTYVAQLMDKNFKLVATQKIIIVNK